MADDPATIALLADAKAQASKSPVKIPEMRDAIDFVASDMQSFAERSVEFWRTGAPPPDQMRRLVALEACGRFLALCEQNADAIKKILERKK